MTNTEWFKKLAQFDPEDNIPAQAKLMVVIGLNPIEENNPKGTGFRFSVAFHRELAENPDQEGAAMLLYMLNDCLSKAVSLMVEKPEGYEQDKKIFAEEQNRSPEIVSLGETQSLLPEGEHQVVMVQVITPDEQGGVLHSTRINKTFVEQAKKGEEYFCSILYDSIEAAQKTLKTLIEN